MLRSKKAVFVVAIILFIFLSSNVMVFLQVFASNSSINPVTPANKQENKVEQTLKLIVLSSPVFVQLPGEQNFIEVKEEAHVPVLSVVATGNTGRAELVYPNKSITRLNVNSKVQIKEFAINPQRSIVTLLQGSIWNRIAKLVGKESFQSEIGDMVATVRGTAYQMQLLPDGTSKMMVEDGTVAIINKDLELQVEQNKQVIYPVRASEPLLEDYYPERSDEWVQLNSERDAQVMEMYPDEYTVTPTWTLPYIAPTRYVSPTPKLEPCIGPDTIHFLATRTDCKNLNDYWNRINPKR